MSSEGAATEKSVPVSLHRQFWQLVGLGPRDTLTALFALPAGIQILTQLYSSLHLAELVRRLLTVWREVTRSLWDQAIAALNQIVSWKLDFTPSEQDALTLTALASGAALTSAIFKRGESLAHLWRRSLAYPTTVRVLGFIVIAAIGAITVAIFIQFQISALIPLELWYKILTVLGAMAIAVLILYLIWAAAERPMADSQALLNALRRRDFEYPWKHNDSATAHVQRRWQKLGLGITRVDIEANLESLARITTSYVASVESRRSGAMMLFSSILVVLAAFTMLLITERIETTFVYSFALAALFGCIATNWKALPIIYVNVGLITALNYALIIFAPIVEDLNDLVTKAGG